MEMFLSVLALLVSCVSAYYALKVSRVQMLGKPYISEVRTTERDGFMCATVRIVPGDFSIRLRSISVPGYRIAFPRQEGFGLATSSSMHMWLPPNQSELREALALDLRVRPQDSSREVLLVISPCPERGFSLRLRTESSFLPMRYKVKVLKPTAAAQIKIASD